MTLTQDSQLINGDEELSQEQMHDLLMNWALMSMDANPNTSVFNPLNFDEAALDSRAKID